MQQDTVSDLIRKNFAAFLAKDRKTLEEVWSDDFRTHHIEKLFVQGNEALVLYQAELKDGTKFRNT